MGVIRFLLALSVLIVHSSPIFGLKLLPGYLAVRSFYIISGFYMAFIFSEKYAKTDRPIYNFYINRFFRLYPIYLLVVILTLLLSVFLGIFFHHYGSLQTYIDQYQQNPTSLDSLIMIFVSNFTLIGQDVLSFFSLGDDGRFLFNGLQSEMAIQGFFFIPIAWTIAVELFFYLITPFIALRTLKFNLAVLAVVLAFRLVLFVFGDVSKEFMIYRFAPTELFWFLLGVISYKISFLQMKQYRAVPLLLFFIIIFCLCFYSAMGTDWLILGLVSLSTPSVFKLFEKNKIDRFIGELTYPLYAGHCLILMIVTANRFPKNFGIGPPAFLITLLFSILVYKYFQKPIDKWRLKKIVLDQGNSN
jgi:peptidoglycan/LPS O-acetylase OafA/YrhL